MTEQQIDAFRLQWPAHVRRTPAHGRVLGSFQVSPETAVQDLLEEVRRSGGNDVIISSNRRTRRDGLPRQGAREPDDPGVAVYFQRKGQQVCIPCDTFDRVWKNIRAVGLSIKDMRGPESRGCAAITDQVFTGFLALLPSSVRPWHIVLGVSPDATSDQISAARKALARQHHGNDAMMSEINAAHDMAMKERRPRLFRTSLPTSTRP